jgi:sodium-dependent dicarboxylate transporter 2/3/5
LQIAKLVGGPAGALATYLIANLYWPHPASAVAAVGVWMACWWMTEAIPLAATALLPILCFPLLGVFEGDAAKQIERATAPYANPNIFLYMGGFILALAIERWGLHRRFALGILRTVGFSPGRLLLGVMGSTYLLSMWISNTAAATIMLPIGLGLCQMARGKPVEGKALEDLDLERNSLSTMLLLSIAYAATIGGMATSVGTPTNGVALSILARNGESITFLGWFLIASPISLALAFITWLVLLWAFRPQVEAAPAEARKLLLEAWDDLGPVSAAEWRVGVVFGITAMSWIFRGPLIEGFALAKHWPWTASIDDTLISVTCALTLFVTPSGSKAGVFLMDWQTAKKLPWDVLLLFGGGLSLAEGMKSSDMIGQLEPMLRGLTILPFWALLMATILAVIFLSELASNVAVATAFTPVIIALAAAVGASPQQLVIASTLAASCGFMLPVATPPNAIVFGTGRIPQRTMIGVGFLLNLLGALVIALGAAWAA